MKYTTIPMLLCMINYLSIERVTKPQHLFSLLFCSSSSCFLCLLFLFPFVSSSLILYCFSLFLFGSSFRLVSSYILCFYVILFCLVSFPAPIFSLDLFLFLLLLLLFCPYASVPCGISDVNKSI